MKTFRQILLLTGIFVAACTFTVSAQTRAENTSSARAIYGGKAGKHHKAKKKKKVYSHGQFLNNRKDEKNSRKRSHHAWAS